MARVGLVLLCASGAVWAEEPSLVERLDRAVQCLAATCTLDQLEASLEATREPAPEGTLHLRAKGLRASLREPAADAPVTEVLLYPDAEARLCLEVLVERFGRYEVGHVSKTSSVRFRLTREGSTTSVDVWTREPPGSPCATVLSLHVRRTGIDGGEGDGR